MLQKWDQKYFDQSKMKSSNFWLSLDWFSNIEDLVKHLPEGKTELVCHPERVQELEIVKKYL